MSSSMRGLHELLLRSADRHGDRPLFVRGKESLSYATIAAKALALAGTLGNLGVAPGDRVAIVLDNVAEYIIATYGTLMAGAVVVPLCSDTRSAALVHPLVHAEVKALVLAARLAPMLAEIAPQTPRLQLVATVGSTKTDPAAGTAPRTVDLAELTRSGSPARFSPGADDLASLMYTSGTTAAPKAVMLSHRNLLANTNSIVEYLALQPEDRAALVLPLYYSYGISVLHTHVQVGASIVAAGSVAFPAAVLRQISEHRCTGLPGVPSTFARLLRSNLLARADLSSLRYLTQAGGPMSPELTTRLRRAIPHAALFVMYGQTEAAPRLSYLPPKDLDRKLGSAGKAIPGVELKVLDELGQAVKVDEVGELVARGENIMLGYWKNEAATRQTLRPEGLRTGDLARMDAEGFIYLVGRNSDQIKSGAHRISPQEIEEVIGQMEAVQECAVIGEPDELLGETIVAFVVRAREHQLSERQILRHCFEQLPKFKQPGRVEFVSELPHTPTGKLKRSALRQRQPGAG